MILGQIFQSVDSWQKLSSINMKAALAYKILKYTKLVGEEHAVVEKQRVALIHEIAGTQVGEEVHLAPETPEFLEYVTRFNAVLAVESDLARLPLSLEGVVDAVDETNESLTVQDLAILEPFFLDPALAVDLPGEDEQHYVDAEKALGPEFTTEQMT